MSGKKEQISQEEEMVNFNIPTHDADGKELTKTARKKLLQKAKKTAQKESFKKVNEQKRAQESKEEADISVGKYGALPRIQSQSREGKTFRQIRNFTAANKDELVYLRARVHTLRVQGNLCFLVLRQRESTIQAVGIKGPISKQMVNFIQKTTPESIIDVEGYIRIPNEPVLSTSQQDCEIEISRYFIVNASQSPLPILLEDAERPLPLIKAQKVEKKKYDEQINKLKAELNELNGASDKDEEKITKLNEQIEVLEQEKNASQKFVVLSRPQRLNNRVLDLRTTTNQAIFKIQSGVCQLFREYLLQQDFTEIHTPKLIGTASEGGADVFTLDYFGKPAYLAQSPQLYKQMVISSDFNRVFEIGSVFRAENSNSPRHMTEFMGLDLEMAFYEHYHEVLDLYDGLFIYIFENIPKRFAKELEVIKRQFPFEDLKYHNPSLRLKWSDAVKLLREAGVDIGDFDDISTPQEKKLGEIVKEKYGTDFYMLDKFPLAVRPFYTMPDPEDPRYSNSYDFFIRGQEILSGAQRIHEPELLCERATAKGVGIDKIKDYVDAFRFGAYPHGGGGIGMERVVMLYLNLSNIQTVTLFPRTPMRITP